MKSGACGCGCGGSCAAGRATSSSTHRTARTKETATERQANAEGLVASWLATKRREPGFYGPRTPLQALVAMREAYANRAWDEALRADGRLGDRDFWRRHETAIRRAMDRFRVVDSRWSWEDFDAWNASGEVPRRILDEDQEFATIREERRKREASARLAAARDAKAPRSKSASVRGFWLSWALDRDGAGATVTIAGPGLTSEYDPLVTAFCQGLALRRRDVALGRAWRERDKGAVLLAWRHRGDAPLRWNDVAFAFDQAAGEVLGPEVREPRTSRRAPSREGVEPSPRGAVEQVEAEPFRLTAPPAPKPKAEQLSLFGKVSGMLKGGR